MFSHSTTKGAPQLQVLAGSSRNDLQTLKVNADKTAPCKIKTHLFEGALTVRIKDFNAAEAGHGVASPESDYLAINSDATWSIQVHGRFLEDISSNDCVFGNVFDQPIRDSLPHGTSAALKAIQYIDTSLRHDVYADKPWAWCNIPNAVSYNILSAFGSYQALFRSPMLATMNFIKLEPADNNGALEWSPERPEEDCSGVVGDGVKGDPRARRKWFSSPENGEGVKLGPKVFVKADFANGYIDFNTLSVNIPHTSFSFSLAKYWDGQDITYICRSAKDEAKVFFVVVFRIVDEDLVRKRQEKGLLKPGEGRAEEGGPAAKPAQVPQEPRAEMKDNLGVD